MAELRNYVRGRAKAPVLSVIVFPASAIGWQSSQLSADHTPMAKILAYPRLSTMSAVDERTWLCSADGRGGEIIEVVPSVASLEELHRAVAGFAVTDLRLVIEPAALAAARRSLDESGFLLLGEVHGVRENPLIIRALMQRLGLSGLALEWPEDLAPMIRAFLAGDVLADHPLLWFGDGRLTAGHLAVLRERGAAGPLSLALFDGTIGAGWSWSQRDEAMARRILAHPAAPAGTLVAAGNAHTPTTRTRLGIPLGACLACHRPGVAEIRIRYGGGRYYNIEPRRFLRVRLARRQPRMRQSGSALVLDLPAACEAVVPQRPRPWPEGRQLR